MTDLRPVVQSPPVAGGLDLDLPGAGVRLRATRWPGGPGRTGAPVLLLHGLASTRHIWDLVVPGLAGLPVVALDQRGHGDSDRPEGPYDGQTVVADTLTALDAVGLSRVVVVGHSWGAWTALRLAVTAPSRVLAVVAVDGGVGRVGDVAPTRAEARSVLEPPRLDLPVAELRDRLRRGPLGPWWSSSVEAAMLAGFAADGNGQVQARLPRTAHLAIVDDLLDQDLTEQLPEVRCPTWLVACSPDLRRSAALDEAAAQLAAPRVQRWDGAVHDVPLQWPALLAGLVRAAAEEVSLLAAGEGAGT